MAEQGVPIDLPSWFAAIVPAATPKPVVNEINRLFSAVPVFVISGAGLLALGLWLARMLRQRRAAGL
jgi:hypothetical protein